MQKGSFSLTIPFRIFYLLFLGFGFLCFSQIAGAQAECPVQLSQQRVVVRYNGSVAVNCSTSVSHKGMGWESSEGAVPKTSNSLIIWRVSHLTEWEIQPSCYINYERQCLIELPVIIYKTPDNVSISIVKRTGPMIEGQQYELQCDVQNVAPVHNLTVKWYKGQTLLDQTNAIKYSRTPVNETVLLLIRPDRDDDGAQYRCEAELDLGAEGPQYPPNKTSDFLSITVYSKPIINETKLPSVVPVFRGYSEEIVCEAEGNPKPTISWILGTNDIVYNEVLTISESTPEYVSCVAENSVGTTTRNFTVFIQDISISTVNHTEPMIAGEQYDLQCSIKYVAPFKIVDVGWYKQNKNNIIETIKTPDILTYTVQIRPNRADNGSQFWCEAKLEAEGTQRTSTMKSANLSITVHFKPIINETKLPSTVPVFRGYSEEIVCEAEGNPKPTIIWILGTNYTVNNETLTISESTPEYVSCVANNSVGTTTRKVKVFIQVKPIINETKLPSVVPVFRGYSEEIVCEAEGNPKPTIIWILGTNYTVNNETLTISESTPEYVSCVAENSVGKTTRKVKVFIQVKPIINETKLPSVVPVFRGYSKEIVCEAEGNPKPTISWILGTNDIVYNEVLTISESTPENVSCVAENSAGKTTRQVKVFIQDISIRTVNHTEPMIAGEQYDLQCSIKYVAPFKIVDVGWYKQNKNNIIETIKTPDILTYTVQIRPDKADNGSHFWCEAKLEAEGTQRTSTMKSANLSITVHFEPIINENKLPSVVPVFRGYSEEIVCEAEGNPKPTISWILGTNDIVYNEVLTISESTPEYVTCVAENSAGKTTRQVNMVLKEDYLPLIAGLIAVTVVFISVIFIFIYSIYYKTAKMGHYSLKDAKPSAQNGDIAQNGKHSPIPMKKFSQSDILA
ncbi:intercellular adhesion molecule 1-like isoform X4 [Carassius auratus]|uniref:Intercellular adhesion molecule 1-like isoform X4 n=1 Tax=Carassius auratus TaxID=7957 RepID=A0A6P6J8X9_CARAU|nr:intercellular adhesion molecule 1-like isoform X4 [Carassius auratus]